MATDENRYVKFLTKKEARKYEGGDFNIFISYSTNDSDKIQPLINQISTIQGIKIFFAEKSIMPGSLVNKTIVKQIVDSDVFLVFFSESALKSNYVQQEIGAAKSHNKYIIPILLDSTKPTGMLDGINYLNFHDPTKQLIEMNRLYQFIVQDVQSKKQGQALKFLGLLALGYFLLKSDDKEDEY
jgi:hypothetical protein